MNMEEKLELRHLAPYLPYKLKMMHYNKEKVLNAGQGSSCNWVGITHAIHHQDKTKPLLYPLDRLTEPILEGGKIPFEELQKLYPASMKDIHMITHEELTGQWMMNTNRDGEVAINIMRQIDDKLTEWHFDHRFDLIRKGLALPIDPK